MWCERDYGNRVGVFRIMEVVDRYGIRATVALNSDLCAQHPQIIAEGEKRHWEWMGHNESNTRRLNELPAGTEAQVIGNTLAVIERHTRPPPGRLAQLGPSGDLGYARSSSGGGLRIRRRLVQRRPALLAEPRRGPLAGGNALYPTAQRQVGDRAAIRDRRRIPADDL
jgi:hypothetical protein